MPEYSIVIKNLTKQFKVYFDKGQSFKERVIFKNRNKHEDRIVLNDISLSIEKGQAVGLIGHNGCGKSTLLKIMTRILYPDKGTIEVKGRVSSLIELGAGFHPDMSGRENIYTNAAIFGLSKAEIDARLEDIIAFSELEEFIDNPVRTYSSGMYMRLAFSVAINVDADVLLIDEILAVGDANFQAKCFDKLVEIKEKGTTIVIVSHSLDQIEAICDRTIWINGGKIVADGFPIEIHPEYMDYMSRLRNEQRKKEKAKKEAKEADKKAEEKKKETAPKIIAPNEQILEFVDHLTNAALGRKLEEEGRQYWAKELANYHMTGEQAGVAFFINEEMEEYDLSDSEFIERAYKAFMGRPSDKEGKIYWLSSLEQGVTREELVLSFTRKEEFVNKCVEVRVKPFVEAKGGLTEEEKHSGSGEAKITKVQVLDKDGEEKKSFDTGSKITFRVTYTADKKIEDAIFGVGIFKEDGTYCYGTNTKLAGIKRFDIMKDGVFEIEMPKVDLLKGKYFADLMIQNKDFEAVDCFKEATSFEMVDPREDSGIVKIDQIWHLPDDDKRG
ncbi:MAG: Wzt carbohydrate-binding domain-containing protein [Clostridiales bacterium]|nr:Wzt carbohydrate-binding domain-containing protein [Clostridiales bacterium]